VSYWLIAFFGGGAILCYLSYFWTVKATGCAIMDYLEYLVYLELYRLVLLCFGVIVLFGPLEAACAILECLSCFGVILVI